MSQYRSRSSHFLKILTFVIAGSVFSPEAWSEEISLKKDRSDLEQLRESIPAEKRQLNDERAFMDELFVTSSQRPSEVRQKFQRELQKRREKFNSQAQKERQGFTKEQNRQRDEFLKSAKAEREAYFKSTKDPLKKKDFMAEQEVKRKEFMLSQKEKRDQFEQKQKEARLDFNENMKLKNDEFSQKIKVYTENYENQKKDAKKPPQDRSDLESWKNIDQQYEYIKKKTPVQLGTDISE